MRRFERARALEASRLGRRSLASRPTHAINRPTFPAASRQGDERSQDGITSSARVSPPCWASCWSASARIRCHPNYPEKAAYLPEVVIEGPAGDAPTGPPDFAACLPMKRSGRMIARGERVRAQCVSCQTFDAGAPMASAELAMLSGAAIASHGGFDYSKRCRRKRGLGTIWRSMNT